VTDDQRQAAWATERQRFFNEGVKQGFTKAIEDLDEIIALTPPGLARDLAIFLQGLFTRRIVPVQEAIDAHKASLAGQS
jgi:hypothetical protein